MKPLLSNNCSQSSRIIVVDKHRRCSVRKCVLRNFAKFTGKENLAQVFFCEFYF